jgi:hypothetical protein
MWLDGHLVGWSARQTVARTDGQTYGRSDGRSSSKQINYPSVTPTSRYTYMYIMIFMYFP